MFDQLLSKNKLSYSTLKLNPNLLETTISLIEDAFHYDDINSFKTDFAPLFHESNLSNCHILIDHFGKVIAHIGVKKRLLRFQDKQLQIAFIGGIAIANSYQGKGLFKNFLNHVLSLLQDIGLLVLWSDKSELYEHLSFQERGLIYQTGNENFRPDSFPEFKSSQLNNLTANQLQQLQHLYEDQMQNRGFYLERSSIEWESIKLISSSQCYFKERQNRLCEYFFVNKGFDLQDIVHEFVGTKETEQKLQDFKYWTADLPNKYFQSLYLGFFKIHNEAIVDQFIFESLRLNSKSLSESEKIDLIVNGQHNGKIYSRPMYICGLDSI